MKRLSALLMVCVAAAFGLAACGDDDKDDSSATTTGATGTTGAGGASGDTGDSGASGATGEAGGGTVRVAADPSGTLKFEQSSLSAKAGKAKFQFTNDSPVPHDFGIDGSGDKKIGKTKVITNDKADLSVNVKPGKYTFYCSVDGHEQAGMKGTLTVK